MTRLMLLSLISLLAVAQSESHGSGTCDDALVPDAVRSTAMLQVQAKSTGDALPADVTETLLERPDKETGIWEPEDLEGRKHTAGVSYWGINTCLSEEMMRLVTERNFKSVLDLGAGSGAYSMSLMWNKRMLGTNVTCCDGNEAIVSTSGGLCSICDLTSDKLRLEPADLVFSLEVAEHIPKDMEPAYLRNLQEKSSSGLLLLSWAHPGQGGNGHVNCRDSTYVIQKMAEAKFVMCEKETEKIRATLSAAECQWDAPHGHERNANTKAFVMNLMAFSKDGTHC